MRFLSFVAILTLLGACQPFSNPDEKPAVQQKGKRPPVIVIANQFKAKPETVRALRKTPLGWHGVIVSLSIAEKTGKDPVAIAGMHKSGMKWPQVAEASGTTMKEIRPRIRKVSRAIKK